LRDVKSGIEMLQLSKRHPDLEQFDSIPSVAFSSDGRHIVVAHSAWLPPSILGLRAFDSAGACIIKNRNSLIEPRAINDPIIITPDAWIVEVEGRRVISKLPSTVAITHYAASKSLIAFTTREKGSAFFIMHNTLTSANTWDPTAYDEGDGYSDWDGDQGDEE
jgi:hypothetical protein